MTSQIQKAVFHLWCRNNVFYVFLHQRLSIRNIAIFTKLERAIAFVCEGCLLRLDIKTATYLNICWRITSSRNVLGIITIKVYFIIVFFQKFVAEQTDSTDYNDWHEDVFTIWAKLQKCLQERALYHSW